MCSDAEYERATLEEKIDFLSSDLTGLTRAVVERGSCTQSDRSRLETLSSRVEQSRSFLPVKFVEGFNELATYIRELDGLSAAESTDISKEVDNKRYRPIDTLTAEEVDFLERYTDNSLACDLGMSSEVNDDRGFVVWTNNA
jgi:hypothetical protein